MTHYDYQCNCPHVQYRYSEPLEAQKETTCTKCMTKLVQTRTVTESHYKANEDVQQDLFDLHDKDDMKRMGM